MKNSIAVYRAKLGITQEELAGKIGITRQTVIALEKNRYNPSLELAFKLARFFACAVEDLFTFEPDKE